MVNQSNVCQDMYDINYTTYSNSLCVLCKVNSIVNQSGKYQLALGIHYIVDSYNDCVLYMTKI